MRVIARGETRLGANGEKKPQFSPLRYAQTLAFHSFLIR